MLKEMKAGNFWIRVTTVQNDQCYLRNYFYNAWADLQPNRNSCLLWQTKNHMESVSHDKADALAHCESVKWHLVAYCTKHHWQIYRKSPTYSVIVSQWITHHWYTLCRNYKQMFWGQPNGRAIYNFSKYIFFCTNFPGGISCCAAPKYIMCYENSKTQQRKYPAQLCNGILEMKRISV